MTSNLFIPHRVDVPITEPISFGLQKLAASKVGSNRRLILQHDETLVSQAYRITAFDEELTLHASDDAGFLYGLLDLRHLPWDRSRTVQPAIKKRGIKYNIPLDARTPSYSDASDIALNSIAKVWDMEFWERYLDLLALNKYNLLSLWSLSPFPSLVKTPGFEEMSLRDVKIPTLAPKPSMSGDTLYTEEMDRSMVTVHSLTIEEKIAFWNDVLAYAHGRCIEVFLFTWNLFIFPNACGLTPSLTDQRTRQYLRTSVEALFESYPLLSGIGITAGEAMSNDRETDIAYLHDTYGRAVASVSERHPDRTITLVHRTHWAAANTILSHYAGDSLYIALSFKYANAHLHSHHHPPFLDEFIASVEQPFPLFLTLRDDDYYLHRWGEIDFAQRVIDQLPADRIEGFFLGSDGYSWGWEDVSRTLAGQLYVEKHWFKLALFGQLAYDPSLDRNHWQRLFDEQYGFIDGQYLEYFSEASSLLREVTCLHWRDWDFQWYVEGCCEFLHPPIAKLSFVSVIDFLEGDAMPHSGYASIRHACLNPQEEGGELHVLAVAKRLEGKSDRIRSYCARLKEHLQNKSAEVQEMSGDMESLALLGAYYALKLQAAYFLGRAVVQRVYSEVPLALLEAAGHVWQEYSASMERRYRPQRFARLCSSIDFRQFDQSAQFDHALCHEYMERAREGRYAVVE